MLVKSGHFLVKWMKRFWLLSHQGALGHNTGFLTLDFEWPFIHIRFKKSIMHVVSFTTM